MEYALAEINIATFRAPVTDPVNADFVCRNSAHREIMRRRREWFDRMAFHMALWWVPAGHRPTIAEGKARLDECA